MEQTMMQIIGHIHTDFPTKFGLPRQSGLVEELVGCIVLEPEFRRAEAFRGIEEFSHLWLLWQFSLSQKETWSATVKPPRLGGKKRMGVFATRSPYRPNPIGLSCVKLLHVDYESENAPLLYVAGVDMVDGTPIYDIKPYLAYADAHAEAKGGFADTVFSHELQVEFPEALRKKLPLEKQKAAIAFLKQDPRPPYHNHAKQVYKIAFDRWDIHFTVEGQVAHVCDVVLLDTHDHQP